MCVLVHEFRASSVLLKVLELISQQKGQPAKNIFPFCFVNAAGVKLTPGCWSGSLPITFQEHPSPLICLVHTSSFLSRNVSLWNLPDPPRQRVHLFFLVLAVLWTSLLFLHMLLCIQIVFALATVSLLFCELLEERVSFIFVSPMSRTVTRVHSREILMNIFEGKTIKIDELFVTAWEIFPSARQPIYRQTFET